MIKDRTNAVIREATGLDLNFYECLNACAQFEAALAPDQKYEFGERLAQMVREPENIGLGEKPTKKWPFNGIGYLALANLTAPQRCEAYLRTIGLWEEEKDGVKSL